MEEILKNIEITLKLLGYTIKEEDREILENIAKKYTSQIMYECAIEELPIPLIYVVSDKVCSEFIKNKLILEQDIGIKIGTNAKNIKIGDISVSFPDNSSNEEKLNILLEKLEHKEFNYAPYRKLRW